MLESNHEYLSDGLNKDGRVDMNVRAKLLTCLMALAMLPILVSASNHEDLPDIPAGWQTGIVSEQDAAPTFEIGLDGSVTVKFWIDNQNMAAINLDVAYDLPFDGVYSGPDTVEVPAQTNKSFDATISEIDVAEFVAEQSDRFIITSTVTGYAGVPLSLGGDSKDAEGNLTIPMVVDLKVNLSEAAGPLNAGTTSSLEVVVTNEGNAVDSVFKVTVSDSCPLLEVGGAEELEGVAIEMGKNLTQNLNISTSDSHPTKKCVIEISIQSRGDMDAGRSQAADSDESTLNIVEDRGDVAGEPDSSSNNDSSENTDVISSNWTPIWPGTAIFAIIWAALTRRKN
jgi:hypothetical protein